MGKILIGFIVGYILSDWITSKVPQAGQFKILPKPTIITPTTTQPTIPGQASWKEYLREFVQ